MAYFSLENYGRFFRTFITALSRDANVVSIPNPNNNTPFLNSNGGAPGPTNIPFLPPPILSSLKASQKNSPSHDSPPLSVVINGGSSWGRTSLNSNNFESIPDPNTQNPNHQSAALPSPNVNRLEQLQKMTDPNPQRGGQPGFPNRTNNLPSSGEAAGRQERGAFSSTCIFAEGLLVNNRAMRNGTKEPSTGNVLAAPGKSVAGGCGANLNILGKRSVNSANGPVRISDSWGGARKWQRRNTIDPHRDGDKNKNSTQAAAGISSTLSIPGPRQRPFMPALRSNVAGDRFLRKSNSPVPVSITPQTIIVRSNVDTLGANKQGGFTAPGNSSMDGHNLQKSHSSDSSGGRLRFGDTRVDNGTSLFDWDWRILPKPDDQPENETGKWQPINLDGAGGSHGNNVQNNHSSQTFTLPSLVAPDHHQNNGVQTGDDQEESPAAIDQMVSDFWINSPGGGGGEPEGGLTAAMVGGGNEEEERRINERVEELMSFSEGEDRPEQYPDVARNFLQAYCDILNIPAGPGPEAASAAVAVPSPSSEDGPHSSHSYNNNNNNNNVVVDNAVGNAPPRITVAEGRSKLEGSPNDAASETSATEAAAGVVEKTAAGTSADAGSSNIPAEAAGAEKELEDMVNYWPEHHLMAVDRFGFDI